MKRLVTSIVTLVFAGSVGAADDSFIYHGFEKHNPDLYSGYASSAERTAVQPGVGDRADRSQRSTAMARDSYSHWVADNPDSYSGYARPGQMAGMHSGVGDRFHAVSMQRKLDLMSSDSYDAWTAGNPDQEDGH